jgi:hypothetical protein
MLFAAAFWVLTPRARQAASFKKKNGTNAIAIMGRESLDIEIHLCLPLGLCYRCVLNPFLAG